MYTVKNVTLPEKLFNEVQAEAKREHRTFPEQVEFMLTEYMQIQRILGVI